MRRSLDWQIATVTDIKDETPRVKSFTLALPAWRRHRAGQHYDLRLTAEDGYQAQRSYSVASAPEEEDEIDLTVERLDDGEVSTYLHDVLIVGDRVEVRGPIGGYFVWEKGMGGPLFLVAGGSGIVPLMAMLRHKEVSGSRVLVRLLYSARSAEDLIYAGELDRRRGADPDLGVAYTLTRYQPEGWTGYSRRVDANMLKAELESMETSPLCYVCGPTPMVESVANDLVELGIAASRVRTERFGPTGG